MQRALKFGTARKTSATMPAHFAIFSYTHGLDVWSMGLIASKAEQLAGFDAQRRDF